MLKNKKGRLEINLRQKFIIDLSNKCLKPLGKFYSICRNSFVKTKSSFPAIYKYFESLVRHHLITPGKELFQSSKIGDMGSIITTNVMKRLPHVDESQIEEIIHNPSNKSFLEILTKGFGINKKKGKNIYYPRQ